MNLDDLFEMSNLRKKFTGLPVNIYVSSGGSVNKRHGPRIKVMNSLSDRYDPHDTISVMLKKDITQDDVVGYSRLSPDVINEIRDYINMHYDTLMKYWNDEIATDELIELLKNKPDSL
jgi:hypothetical protein